MSHEKFTHLNVKVEGLNGQLPNLDLFNLVTRLSTKEGLRPMVQGIYVFFCGDCVHDLLFQ